MLAWNDSYSAHRCTHRRWIGLLVHLRLHVKHVIRIQKDGYERG